MCTRENALTNVELTLSFSLFAHCILPWLSQSGKVSNWIVVLDYEGRGWISRPPQWRLREVDWTAKFRGFVDWEPSRRIHSEVTLITIIRDETPLSMLMNSASLNQLSKAIPTVDTYFSVLGRLLVDYRIFSSILFTHYRSFSMNSANDSSFRIYCYVWSIRGFSRLVFRSIYIGRRLALCIRLFRLIEHLF